ncbi:barstar family protein [Streptomyces sp. NPDC001678]|uniref:barstar family protein n=1 Tax=Streptomyces sp. NPDC001678 TaxID=3364599 RepID=UPI0036C458E7
MTRPLPAPGLPGILNGSIPPGIYHLPPTEALTDARTDAPTDVMARAAEADWRGARLRLTGVHDKAAFLDRCATDLEFPEWFGRNWDALADCLTDLSWWGSGKFRGYLLLAEDWETFRKAAPGDARTAEAVLHDAVEYWASTDSPLVVLLG